MDKDEHKNAGFFIFENTVKTEGSTLSIIS